MKFSACTDRDLLGKSCGVSVSESQWLGTKGHPHDS